jgi:hypothetical protein
VKRLLYFLAEKEEEPEEPEEVIIDSIESGRILDQLIAARSDWRI